MTLLRFASGDKVGIHHSALYRSWINGLDMSESGDRYIAESDPRVVRKVVIELRTRFVQAARRAGKPRYARLLAVRFPKQKTSDSAGERPLPSLDEFREEFDPDDFYSEDDLINKYLEVYPSAKSKSSKSGAVKSNRRDNYIKQQISALFWIEQFLCSAPLVDDPLDAWLEGSALSHLEKADINTMGQLKKFLEDQGPRWWEQIPGIGPTVAKRVAQWLMDNAESLGKLAESAIKTRHEVAKDTQDDRPVILSIALKQEVPGSVSSSARTFELAEQALHQLDLIRQPVEHEGLRLPPSVSLIRASDDWEAMKIWIESKGSGSAHTARAYRKEVERFLLFLAQEQSKDLNGLSVEDLSTYRNFLSLLGRMPDDQWHFKVRQSDYFAPRNTPRLHPDWRPFEGPLSGKSAQYSLGVVKTFLDYLVGVRYITANPMRAISTKLVGQDMRDQVKGLSRGQWQLLLDHVQELEPNEANARLKFATVLAYVTAARRSELALLTTADVSLIAKEPGPGYVTMVTLTGKGDKKRYAPLNELVFAAWAEYAGYRHLSPHIGDNVAAAAPLLATLTGEALSDTSVYRLALEAFKGASERARDRGLWNDAQTLEKFATHALRHSRARHLVTEQLPLNVVQRLLGHASIATTGIYAASSDMEMAEMLEKSDANAAKSNRHRGQPLSAAPLPHHPACGSAPGGSRV